MRKNMKKKIVIIPLVIVAFAIFTFLFQLLWNCIIPDVFGLNAINYWQSLGILIISKILFGGFGFKNNRTPFGPKRAPFTENLSEEERQKLREEWKSRCQKK